MECRSVHQVAMKTWNYLSTTSLPVLAPAGRLCLPPPLPLTADPPQSLFSLALQDPVQLLLLHPIGSSIKSLQTMVNQGHDCYYLPPNPPTKPKKKKEKEKDKDKNCLLGKPGITTEQNRTRGGDTDTGRGTASFVPCSFPQTARGTVHVVTTCISYLGPT